MALDRHDDEDAAVRPNDARPEQHQWSGGSSGDASTARAEPSEGRTRAEYFEALRSTDGKPVLATVSEPETSDTPEDHAGWDGVDARNRPPLDALRITAERTKHVLDGEANGSGGHRHGVGNPGKTEFPASWDDKKIMDNILDIAHRPDQAPIHQNWNDRWLARGKRDDVEIAVVITSDGLIWSGWPRLGSPGVVKNPQET